MTRDCLGCIVTTVVLLVFGLPARAQSCLNWMQAEAVPNDFVIQEAEGAYDTSRNVMVFFGGQIDANTRELDGTTWTEIPSKGPGARSFHAMTYDALRQVVVMFGGYAAGTGQYLSGTWVWNGSMWTLTSTSGPSPRYGHAMVFDVALGKTVLFGGFDAAGYCSDTWTWDGIEWEQLPITGPSARRYHAMAFDEDRARVVLFGGRGSSGLRGDTWEFDGSVWLQRATSGPETRERHELAYDRDRQVTLMYDGVGTYDGTWIWDGNAWEQQEIFDRQRPSVGSGYVLWYDRLQNVARLLGSGYEEMWTIGIGNLFTNGQPPTDQSVSESAPVVLRFDIELYDPAVCMFTGPASIQWRHQGVPIVDDGRVIGSETNALGIFPVQLSDAGEYDIVITRPCGAVTTLPVLLTVTPASAECFHRADVNESGWVDFDDIIEVLATWGQGCP